MARRLPTVHCEAYRGTWTTQTCADGRYIGRPACRKCRRGKTVAPSPAARRIRAGIEAASIDLNMYANLGTYLDMRASHMPHRHPLPGTEG